MTIISHVTIGVDDLERAKRFWDPVLASLKVRRLFDGDRSSGYGIEKPDFILILPLNGEEGTVGNGSTIGFVAPDRAAIREFHARALANGGTDEGAPGLRDGAEHLYAAYVRDPYGHKAAALCYAPE